MMGFQKNDNKKKNVKRLGKIEQLGDIVSRWKQHNEQQQHYKALQKEVEAKREAEKQVQNCADANHEQAMEEHKLWWIANNITNFIWKTLTICPRPLNKKLMMAKAISHVKVHDDFLDFTWMWSLVTISALIWSLPSIYFSILFVILDSTWTWSPLAMF